MFYDNEFVDGLVKKLRVPGGDEYLKQIALSIGDMLKKNRRIYKSFGVYWWAVKDALRQFYPDKAAWFMGPYSDELMKERAWHGDLFRSVLAGVYYHGRQEAYVSDHSWTDPEGVDHSYTLFDENAGF